MTARNPLVLVSGKVNELPSGDAITSLTQNRFDNSSAVATTAFVQSVGIHSGGTMGYYGSATLTSADIGRPCFAMLSTAGTLTLPSATGLLVGATLSVYNAWPAACTLLSPGPTIYAKGGSSTSIVLNAQESILLQWDGIQWMQLVGGSFTQSVTGLIKSSGTVQTAAVAGTDYEAPGTTCSITADRTFSANLIETSVVANTSTAYTVTERTMHDLTLTGNCTFTFPALAAGKQFTLFLKQDTTGSRTITWPVAVRWSGGIAPIITATISKTDVISFLCDGAYWMGFVGGQNFTRA